MAVAMDESLIELTPEELTPWPNLKAIVLKPTALGLERSMQFARRGRSLGLIPVVSSAFESSLGLTVTGELAAVLNTTDVPVGLDTVDCLQQDVLLKPLRITGGELHLSQSVIRPEQLRRDLLHEVRHA